MTRKGRSEPASQFPPLYKGPENWKAESNPLKAADDLTSFPPLYKGRKLGSCETGGAVPVPQAASPSRPFLWEETEQAHDSLLQTSAFLDLARWLVSAARNAAISEGIAPLAVAPNSLDVVPEAKVGSKGQ